MILLIAVLAGGAAGLARAAWRRSAFDLRPLKDSGLLFSAALLQAAAFFFHPTRKLLPVPLAALFLVASLLCLLAFVWQNCREQGFCILGAGLALNLLVICANGGLMPISPEIASRLFPAVPAQAWESGARLGWSKDILLPPAETHLGFLSDRFLLPAWFPWRFAFSFGDVIIALGAFWILWARGGSLETITEEGNVHNECDPIDPTRKNFDSGYRRAAGRNP
jgi:hypothetical protein